MNDHLKQLVEQAKSEDNRKLFKSDLKKKVGTTTADKIMREAEEKLKNLKKIKKS